MWLGNAVLSAGGGGGARRSCSRCACPRRARASRCRWRPAPCAAADRTVRPLARGRPSASASPTSSSASRRRPCRIEDRLRDLPAGRPERRAWMHASGAIATKLAPFVVAAFGTAGRARVERAVLLAIGACRSSPTCCSAPGRATGRRSCASGRSRARSRPWTTRPGGRAILREPPGSSGRTGLRGRLPRRRPERPDPGNAGGGSRWTRSTFAGGLRRDVRGLGRPRPPPRRVGRARGRRDGAAAAGARARRRGTAAARRRPRRSMPRCRRAVRSERPGGCGARERRRRGACRPGRRPGRASTGSAGSRPRYQRRRCRGGAGGAAGRAPITWA